MTIRYSCTECESVIKIRDELAGKKTKCPKCKTPFTIPKPESVPEPVAAAAVQADTMLDMPQEVTPHVSIRDTDLFQEPAEASAESGEATPKPSIAELMREHEEKKKKPATSGSDDPIVAATDVSSVAASGMTAADMINRNYDEKRNTASAPPPLTREERREAEQKELLKGFMVKGGAALAGMAVVGYFLISWMLSDPLPDLYTVTGVVTREGQPLQGVRVQFSLQGEADKSGFYAEAAGTTDAQGNYTLYYDELNAVDGCRAGTHKVIIMTSDMTGQYGLPPSDETQEVSGSTTIDFKL